MDDRSEESLSDLDQFWNTSFSEPVDVNLTPAIGLQEITNAPRPVRGEDENCGSSKVRCGIAQVTIPAGTRATSIERHVKEQAGGPWTQPEGIGWCSWERWVHEANSDGTTTIGCQLKNWSHTRTRVIRIIVHYR